MCGEKYVQHLLQVCHLGSPPHVRGKVKLVPERGVTLGITPACAGKSVSLNVLTLVFRDHPRMCGEKACWPYIHQL